MTNVKWIKIVTDFFENEKIDYILGLPEADALVVIWIRLLILAGKANLNGYIMLTEDIVYNDEMLAHKCRKPTNLVRAALEIFTKLKMIIQTDNGYQIKNWEKYQNIEGLEKIRLNARLRQKRFKEKQKEISDNVSDNVIVTQKITQITPLDLRSKNIDLKNKEERKKEKRKKEEITVQKNEPTNSNIYEDILNHFNKVFSDLYNPLRLTKKKIDQLRLRLKTYSLDDIKTAINNCHDDPFCRGNNKSGWKADWDYLFRNDERIDKYLNLKGSNENGRSRTYQKSNRGLVTADDYDEPEYRDLVRASERKLENLSEVPPDG